MGWWWEEDRQILSCLQELALNALDFPGSFVKIFLLSIDAPVEVGLSSYKLWHMAIVLVVWFTLFWLVPPKREWLGHVRPRVTTQSLQQPRKSLSWKETWKKGLALQGHSGEKRECLHAFLFLWCFVHLHLSFFFFSLLKLLVLTSLQVKRGFWVQNLFVSSPRLKGITHLGIGLSISSLSRNNWKLINIIFPWTFPATVLFPQENLSIKPGNTTFVLHS